MKNVAIVFMAACVLSVPVQAASVYVDASTSNTANVGGGTWYSASHAIDNLWALRTGYANNDNFQLGTPGNEIFDSGGAGVEDSPAIVTTASGLTPGQWYQARVIYWSTGTDNWCIRAGLSQDGMTLFDRAGTLGAAGVLTGKTESNRMELSCFLGQIAADTNGQIKVYIDDKLAGSSASRSWYDGVVLTPILTTVVTYSNVAGNSVMPNHWGFYWNKPDGWSVGNPGNSATGEITNVSSWTPLQWSGSQWTADGDNTANNPPSDYLRLNASGGHPGSAGTTRDLDRYAIAVYWVEVAGDYQIGQASIKTVSGGNGLMLKVFVNGQLHKSIVAPANELTHFDTRIEGLSVNDAIAVAIGSNGSASYDSYSMDYTIALATPSFDGLSVFNVADYGAVGNGVTDDMAAIRNAANAAKQAGGGIVRFDGTKTYRAIGNSSPSVAEALFALQPTGNVKAANIKFEGNGATLLLQPPDRLTYIDEAENIQIDNFIVDYSPLPYFQGQILSADTTNLTIDIQVPVRYPVPNINPGWDWHWGRTFVPYQSGSHAGYGSHLYFDSIEALDGTGRLLRVHAASDMGAVVQQAKTLATELILPQGDVRSANFLVRLQSSSRVTLSNIQICRAIQFIINPAVNTGPVTFSNVSVMTPNPETERFVSWRDCFHVKGNRFGILIENSGWDNAMYDDLFNFSAAYAEVTAFSGTNVTLNADVEGWSWKAGDWVSIWSSAAVRRGVARIVSLESSTFIIGLDGAISGIAVGDYVINEAQLNRDSVVRNCTTYAVGGRGGSARIRSSTIFKDCMFTDTGWSITLDLGYPEGPFPKNIVFQNVSFDRSAGAGGGTLMDIDRASDMTLRGCTFKNSTITIGTSSKNIFFDSGDWINQDATRKILNISGSSGTVYLYGGSTVNGSSSGLSNWVTCASGSTINYSAPPGQQSSVPNPNPATFDAAPWAISFETIEMAAVRGSSEFGPIDYYFEETSGNPGANHSGWQGKNQYVNTGLTPGLTYSYRVRMRDAMGNIGDYSSVQSVSVPLPSPDMNADGEVDIHDLAALASRWLDGNCQDSHWCNGADLNAGGQVDLDDVGILGMHWLESIGN